MFEPDLGPMPDDDDELDDELNDVGLLTREAPAAKATKAKSAPREKPAAPKSSAWELTGNAELDALFQSSTLTARSLNVAASRPSTTGPSQGKPLRSTPVEVPISRAEKILAKLAEQKEEDDKESKKLDRQRKRVEDDARVSAAAASARAATQAFDAQLAGAIKLGRDVDEKAAMVEAALAADAGDGSDETPSPRDVARALLGVGGRARVRGRLRGDGRVRAELVDERARVRVVRPLGRERGGRLARGGRGRGRLGRLGGRVLGRVGRRRVLGRDDRRVRARAAARARLPPAYIRKFSYFNYVQ